MDSRVVEVPVRGLSNHVVRPPVSDAAARDLNPRTRWEAIRIRGSMLRLDYSTVVKFVISRARTQVTTSSHAPVTIKRPTSRSTSEPVSWMGRRWVRSQALTRPAR